MLRSTLPVDARQTLTTQLGQALVEGQAKLGSQQAGDIAVINEKLGNLRIQRTSNIADLARALESQDIARQELALKRAAMSRGSGGRSTPQWQFNQQALQMVAGKWKPGGDGFVNPAQWNALRSDWIRAGFKAADFDSQFASLINPAHFQFAELPQYSVSSSVRKQFD